MVATLTTHSSYCSWCEQEFTIKNSSQLGALRRGWRVYCSTECGSAMERSLEERKKFFGPCPTCGKMFKSRTKKTFCTMRCYTSSPQFASLQKKLQASNAKKKAERMAGQKPCLNCGEVELKKNHLFCSKTCRREFFAARFDRWVANPEQIALPQCYDEFLDSDELPCLIDGCDWRGKFLSAHCNYAHGITAEKLKELAGFNRTTGLISKDLSQALSEIRKRQQAEGLIGAGFVPGFPGMKAPPSKPRRLEGNEHAAKARALMVAEGTNRPPRQCRQCGVDVTQPTLGRKEYCTTRCRSAYYKAIHSAELLCGYCGVTFMGSPNQVTRAQKKLPVYCNATCRAIVNSNCNKLSGGGG